MIHTHYDNLKVARNAPPEVIRAAYKSLSLKFHPDRNPGNSEATRIMAIINASYGVLSDTEKRQQHDMWIAQQEYVAQQTAHSIKQQKTIPQSPFSQPQLLRLQFFTKKVFSHILKNWIAYGLLAFFVWIWAIDNQSTYTHTPPPGPKPYDAAPQAVQNEYIRPNQAPNGQTWPSSAGYVKGYNRLHTGGFSTVTIDNNRNNSDVFVKLVSLDGTKAYPVRQFYIPAFGSFTLNKVTMGSYDIRYRDLSNGQLARSETFSLEEIPTSNGIQYSKLRMTLYKVQNGNMKTYELSETEF